MILAHDSFEKIVDIHTHILPEMDDGASSREITLGMLEEMEKQGIRYIISTSHFYPLNEDPDSFLERRSICKKNLEDVNTTKIQLLYGAEVAYYPGIGKSKEVSKLMIENTGFLLLEMPFMHWDHSVIEDLLALIRENHIRPILAHIDRYIPFHNLNYLNYLNDYGILMQVNAEVFLNPKLKRIKMQILKGKLIHFLGSDAHNMTTRAPQMGDALCSIAKEPYGEELLYELQEYAFPFRRLLEQKKNL